MSGVVKDDKRGQKGDDKRRIEREMKMSEKKKVD